MKVKKEGYRKYFSKTDVARMFGYSSLNSFCSSSGSGDVIKGVDAVVLELEGMFGRVLVRAMKDLDCSITHYDKKDMK